MPNTISQKICFRDTKTKVLYDLYLDSKKHSAATGSYAHISPVEGEDIPHTTIISREKSSTYKKQAYRANRAGFGLEQK